MTWNGINELSPSGAISKQRLQNTVDRILSLEAEARETQAELDSLDAQIGGTTVMAHPAVDLAKHQLIEAHLEYSRQQIGRRYQVISRNERRKWAIVSTRVLRS